MSCAVIRTRLPCLRTLPSRMVPTFSFSPTVRRSSVFPLNWKEEVRAATRSPGILARSLSSSSARPSEKYSCSLSELMFTKGSTAIEAVPGAAVPAEPLPPRPSQKAAATTSTATSTPTGTRIFQRFAGGAALTAGCEPDGAAAILPLEALAAAEPDTGAATTGCGGSSTVDHGAARRFRFTLQALEIGAHLRGVLIAQVAVFLQRLVDDPFQFGGNFGIQAHRRCRRLVQNGIEDHPEVSPSERQRARSPFRRAPRRRRTDPCAHPVPCPRPARATCRPPCPACCRDWSGVLRSPPLPPWRPRPRLGFAAASTLASPKSSTLAWPRLVTKMLAGLMSR